MTGRVNLRGVSGERVREAAEHVLDEPWFRVMHASENGVFRRLAAQIALAAAVEEIEPRLRRQRLSIEKRERKSAA